MNILKDLFGEQVRRTIYLVYALVGIVLGAIQVAFATASVDQPAWFMITFAVYAYLGVALGLTAFSNTQPAPQIPISRLVDPVVPVAIDPTPEVTERTETAATYLQRDGGSLRKYDGEY